MFNNAKRCLCTILAFFTVLTLPASALAISDLDTTTGASKQKSETITRDYSFEALKAEVLKSRNFTNVEVVNLGAEEYADGLKNQRILVIETSPADSRSSEYKTKTGTAIDHWFRGPFTKGKAVADVKISATFKYNGSNAKVVSSSDSCQRFDTNATYTKKSITETDGVTLVTTAKVDLKYTMLYKTGLADSETVTVKCGKDGKITSVGQDELI